MNLTLAEFSRFNIKSKLQLLEMEGRFVLERKIQNNYSIKLYKICMEYVEVVTSLSDNRVIRVDPMVSKKMLELYRGGWLKVHYN